MPTFVLMFFLVTSSGLDQVSPQPFRSEAECLNARARIMEVAREKFPPGASYAVECLRVHTVSKNTRT